jgi:hypothetical protein
MMIGYGIYDCFNDQNLLLAIVHWSEGALFEVFSSNTG